MVGHIVASSGFGRKLVRNDDNVNSGLVSEDVSDPSASSIVQQTLEEPTIVIAGKDHRDVGGGSPEIVDVFIHHARDIAIRTTMDLQRSF